MANPPSDGERLMAYYEVGKIINEAKVGALAVVRGIHDENELVVSTGTHIMAFSVTRVEAVSDQQTIVCKKCDSFAVPAPLDHVGEALMAAHTSLCKGEG